MQAQNNETMQTITTKAIELIRGNQKVIGRLMALFNKSSDTINRWIDGNDIRLTTFAALQILREETELTDDQILEETPEAVTGQ
jgi:hypothetical protein